MKTRSVLLTAVLTVMAACDAYAFEIVKEGKPNAVVVRAADADRLVQKAVEDFLYHVKLITGAELPVVTDAQEPEQANRICIGASRFTKTLGIDMDALPQEGFRILTKGNVLAIVGRDKPIVYYRDGKVQRIDDDPMHRWTHTATWSGVAHYFEKYHGVRWLWPGEEGIYYEKKKTLQAGEIDEVKGPSMIYKCIRGVEGTVWARRMRLGVGGELVVSHAMHFFLQYEKEHPEYFAQQPDGTRNIYGDRKSFKLCISNPDVAKILIERGRKYFASQDKTNIARYTYNMGFNDCDGWCFCDKCKALDAMDQKTRTYPARTQKKDGSWAESKFTYPYLTDRYVWLWNKVATEVCKEYPDRYIGVYRYGAVGPPPVRERLHPNILVSTTMASDLRFSHVLEGCKKELQGWFDRGLKAFYWRPNLMSFNCYGLSYFYVDEVGALMQYLMKAGIKGIDIDTWQNHWGTEGVNIYVVLRMMWDPELDPDQVIREYCEKGFGKAAPAVYDYYMRCKAIREDMIRDRKKMPDVGGDTRSFLAFAHHFYTEEALRDLEEIGRKIEELSKNDEEQFRRRVGVLLAGLKYTLIQGRLLLALNKEDKAAEDYNRAIELVRAKDTFFQNLDGLNKMAVSVPTLRSLAASGKLGPWVGENYRSLLDKKVVLVLPDKWAFYQDKNQSGEAQNIMTETFDDSKLPQLSINAIWERQGYEGYNGIGWYRTRLHAPAQKPGKRYYLWFGSIDESYWIYLNGAKVGENVYDDKTNLYSWHTPFTLEVTDRLQYDRDNLLVVKVRDVAGQGGIYKGALLLTDAE